MHPRPRRFKAAGDNPPFLRAARIRPGIAARSAGPPRIRRMHAAGGLHISAPPHARGLTRRRRRIKVARGANKRTCDSGRHPESSRIARGSRVPPIKPPGRRFSARFRAIFGGGCAGIPPRRLVSASLGMKFDGVCNNLIPGTALGGRIKYWLVYTCICMSLWTAPLPRPPSSMHV